MIIPANHYNTFKSDHGIQIVLDNNFRVVSGGNLKPKQLTRVSYKYFVYYKSTHQYIHVEQIRTF